MEHRVFTCAACGKQAVDMSMGQNKRFCSKHCKNIAYEMNRKMRRESMGSCCIHNKEIQCFAHKCSNCGWNPNVETRRKEALGYG